MKNNNFIKRLASFMLIFAMVFSIIPMNDIGYAEKARSATVKVIDLEGKEILKEESEIKKDETGLEFFKKVLDNKKMDYLADEGYISSINGLAAMDRGQYSGWMTKVNGEMPNVGLGDIKLQDKDEIELFYLQNYNSLFNKGKGKVIVSGLEDEKILNSDFVEYKKDEMALDFLKRVLDENKIDYNADGGYVSSVAGLKAGDKGDRSGWMVKVNDIMPEVGLGDIKTEDGIVIEVFYVEDYETLFPPEEGGDVDELFVDMGKHEWAKEAVESLAIEGVLEGTGNNKFAPAKEVTRAEFATMVSRLLKLDKLGENEFKDVKKTDWYYESVLKVSAKGYMNGKSNTEFVPREKISRQEIATIVGNILEDNDVSLENKEAIKEFVDYKTIAKWAELGSALTVEKGIINGIDGKFMPRKTATRAEAATILYRLQGIIK